MVGWTFFSLFEDNVHELFEYELLCSINSYKHCLDDAKQMIVLFVIIFSWLVAIFKRSEQLLWERDTCENGALESVCSLVKFVRDLKQTPNHPSLNLAI